MKGRVWSGAPERESESEGKTNKTTQVTLSDRKSKRTDEHIRIVFALVVVALIAVVSAIQPGESNCLPCIMVIIIIIIHHPSSSSSSFMIIHPPSPHTQKTKKMKKKSVFLLSLCLFVSHALPSQRGAVRKTAPLFARTAANSSRSTKRRRARSTRAPASAQRRAPRASTAARRPSTAPQSAIKRPSRTWRRASPTPSLPRSAALTAATRPSTASAPPPTTNERRTSGPGSSRSSAYSHIPP
jgi:hypothetical protein